LWSLLVGVGHIAVCAAIPGNLSKPCEGPPFGPSCAHGVGHIAITCPDSFGSPREFTLPFARSIASSATGVCQRAGMTQSSKRDL
jgi:hypothetical protein